MPIPETKQLPISDAAYNRLSSYHNQISTLQALIATVVATITEERGLKPIQLVGMDRVDKQAVLLYMEIPDAPTSDRDTEGVDNRSNGQPTGPAAGVGSAISEAE